MKKPLTLSIIETTATWIAILFPLLIVAGKTPVEIGVTTLAIFFIIYVFITKDFRFLKEKWVVAICILWLYLVIRSFFTPDIKHALAKFFPFIRFILFALCLEFLVSKDTSSKIFIVLSIILTFLVLDGFIQLFIGHDIFGRARVGSLTNFVRLTGPFSKLILGTTIATMGIVVIAGLIPFLKKSKHYFLPIFISGILIYIIIFFSGERAALLRFSISIALLWLMLLLKAKDIKTKKHLWTITIISFVVCLTIIKIFILLKIANVNRQIISPLYEITHSESSAYILLWKTGIKAGFSNILFGIGPNQFASFFKSNLDTASPLYWLTKNPALHPHNIWIELFAESGLIGITLFTIFLYTLSRKFIKFYQNHDLFECSLIIGISLAALQRLLPLPSSGFFKNWYAIPIWFAIGWMLYLIRTKQSKTV